MLSDRVDAAFGAGVALGRRRVLRADDTEQLQLSGALGTGRGREPEEALAAVLAEQTVAVQLDDARSSNPSRAGWTCRALAPCADAGSGRSARWNR